MTPSVTRRGGDRGDAAGRETSERPGSGRPEAAGGGPEPGRTGASPRAQSVWMSGARTITGILTLAIPLVLVRVLTQSDFGYYKALFLVAITAQTLLSLGVPGSLFYFVPRNRREGHRYQTQSFLILVLLGGLAGALVWAGGDLIQRLFHADLSRYMPLLSLFVALGIPASLVPVAPMVEKRAGLAAGLEIGLSLLRAGLLIGFAVVFRDLFWIMIAACISMSLYLGAALWFLVRGGSAGSWRPAAHRIREQLRYVLPYSGAATIGFARQKVHAYYVGAAFSAETFAVYAAATITIPFVGRVSQTIEEVVVLENAEHHSAGRGSEVRRVWHRASHLLGLVVIPVWLIAEAFAPELITLLYGQAYAGATPIFRIFLFMLPLSLFLGSPMLRATGATGVMVAADTFALLASLAVLVGFVGTFGPLAAVASLVVGKAAFMLAAAGHVARRLELRVSNLLPWRTIAATAAVAGLAALGVERAVDGLGFEGVVKLILGGALATGLYAVGIWVTGLLPESEKRFARARCAQWIVMVKSLRMGVSSRRSSA